MKQTALIVFGWLALMLGITAHAASFDCAKAGTKIEKLICGDAELSKLDEELNAAYKTAVHNKTKADAVKQAQKRWMKERNGCADAACVKRAYEARLSSLTGTHTSSDDSAATKESAKDNSQNGQPYHFQLTKGKGIQVCDAYLERLNTTVYIKPPYCDRPENFAVKGFARLNRVPLSPADVLDLYPIIWDFMGMANHKDLDWEHMDIKQRMKQIGESKLTEEGAKHLQMDLDGGWAKMWRYDPPIDIDNDGKSDNVEIWHGSIVGGMGGTKCGEYMLKLNIPSLRQPQIAFVITGSNDRLDVSKMVKIFGHPKGGYPLYTDGHWRMADGFRPIGRAIGIFKYQDIYYFDTFFDGWGDFENKRQTVYTQSKNMQIANTLAIFLHKNGKTKQVCEYLMTDNKSQTERGTK